MFPERGCGFVGVKYIKVAFLNAFFRERREAVRNERAGNAALPVFGQDDKMLEIAAPSVMARHETADNIAVKFRDETQSRVALQVARG